MISHSRIYRRRIALFSTIVMLVSLRAMGANYYFSTSGNDQTGNGSQQNPWRSVTKFNSLDLNPGDAAYFRAGDVFQGSLMLDMSDSGVDAAGSLIAPITIGSYGGAQGTRAVIRSTPAAEALLAVNAGGIHLRDLEFTNGGTYASNPASGIQFRIDQSFSGPAEHLPDVRLDNIVSHGFRQSGLAFDAESTIGYEGIRVTNSQFYDNQFAGLVIGSAAWTDLVHHDVTIDGVVARNNPGFAGCTPHCGHGIVVGQVDSAVIENSEAYSNGITAGKGNVGIWAWQSNGVVIQRNSSATLRLEIVLQWEATVEASTSTAA
jgi:hypothetical protein